MRQATSPSTQAQHRSGFIAIPRALFVREQGDPLWLEPRRFSRFEAWLDLVQLAPWTAREIAGQGHQQLIPRGHVLVSIRHLAARWSWSKDAARRFVAALISAERLRTVRETPLGTLYRIVSYEDYQGRRDSESDTERATSGTPSAPATGQYEQVENKTTSSSLSPADAARCDRTRRLLPDEYQRDFMQLVAAVPNPATWAAELEARLTGLHPPAIDPLHMGRAIRDYLASGAVDRASLRQFRRYVEGAADPGSGSPRSNSRSPTPRAPQTIAQRAFETTLQAIEDL